MITAFFAGAVTGLTLMVAVLAIRLGRNQEKISREEQEHETEHAAMAIRDRLEHDSAYRQRVRERFTR